MSLTKLSGTTTIKESLEDKFDFQELMNNNQ